MNNANIGSASSVIGNPVNLIMSNATEEQLKKYDGNLGLPEHSLIIINPLNNNTNIDSTWNDICITDNNNGIKHIIPFTSINKSQMYIETSDSGERTLHISFPATSIDDTFFSCENGVLSAKGFENLDEKIKEFNSDVDEILSSAYESIDNYNTVATKYGALIDSIKSLAEQDDIVNQIGKKVESINSIIEDINNIDEGTEEKINDVGSNLNTLDNKQKELSDKIEEINDLIKDIIPENGNESKILEDIKSAVNEANESFNDFIEKYDIYKTKLDNLIDNTKDELHREYEALKNSLDDCVNNNLLPLIEAQVNTCLSANDNIKDLFGETVKMLLANGNDDAETGILNTVAKALSKDDSLNPDTKTEAINNLTKAVETIAEDKAALAVEPLSIQISTALSPKYVDKRYFAVEQLKEIDDNAPENEKQYIVITLSKPLRDFFKEQLGEEAFASLHGAIQF